MIGTTSIDFEAHFYTKAIFDYLKTRKEYPRLKNGDHPNEYYLEFTDTISLFQTQAFIDILCDIGDDRIKTMDQAQLDTQVLSFSSPGIDEFHPDIHSAGSFAVELNDIISDAMNRHPKRFMGFSTISPYDVPASVKELERTIKKLGFVGWLTHSNFGYQMQLDEKQYWPLLEAAEALSIPIYIHPTTPLTTEVGCYGFALAGPPLGFQMDVALCLLRMIYAGVFDQFPKLKIMLGHMGETIPFLMPERIDWAYKNPHVCYLDGFIKTRPAIKRTPAEVIQENVYVTTSGRFSKPLLDYVIQVMGEDRVLLATDYPYEDLVQSMNFIRQSGLPKALLEKICYKNANQIGIG